MNARNNRGPQPKALAIVAAIALAGLILSFVVGRGGSSSAEKHAVDIADNAVPGVMDPSDLTAPVIGSRYDQIATALEKTISDPNIMRITVWEKTGAVVFSTNPDLVGLSVSGAKPMIDAALAGKVESSVGVGDSTPTDGSQQGETFRTFAPLRFQPGEPVAGVVEIVQPVPSGSDSRLWSTAKFGFNAVLVVSLIWLYIAMGRPSEKAARARKYDEKLRGQYAAAGVSRPEPAQAAQAASATRQPVTDGPLFGGPTPPVRQPTGSGRRLKKVGPEVAAMDTWAFGPGEPDLAKRKPPKIKPEQPKVAKPAAAEPAAAEPASVEPASVEPASVEPAAVEPAAVEPAAVEPAAVEPAAVGHVPVHARSARLGDRDLEEEEGEGAKEEFDPGAWIVPRSEQEARRREALLSGAAPMPSREPAAPEPAEVQTESAEAERAGHEAALEAQAARDARDAERDASKAAKLEAVEAEERQAAEAVGPERIARALERERAQEILAAELKAMAVEEDHPQKAAEREAAEGKEREAAEAKEREAAEAAERLAEAREAALSAAREAREESARAAARAQASREKARAAEEAARAARDEISELEAEIMRLEEARRVEARAQEKVRAARDAARAAQEEERQLEEEARRLRDELRRS